MITAPRRTMQQAFDHMWTAIIAQGKPAYDGYGCQYQTPDGNACAIGCLFEPEDRELLPYGGIGEAELVEAADPNIEGDEDRDFAKACQRAHDTAVGPYFVKIYKDNMHAVAKRFALTVPS